MEDHIFGTYATDALKFAHERAVGQGLQHRARTIPLDPGPDEPFALVVTSGADFPVQEVVVRYTTNGDEPDAGGQQLAFDPVRRTWSTPAWGYVTEWRAHLPGLPEGTLLRYRIAGRTLNGPWQHADFPEPQRVVEHALVQEQEIEPDPQPPHGSEFARSIDRFGPPAWAQEAVIYQVFLDRFARAGGAAWPAVPLDAVHGGNLRGVIDKLEHIAGLGCTCLWLSPLFPSPTYHGYDATDYYAVEPRLGTKADLQELVARAHDLGLRVLLDFVCNHCSHHHPRFQQALAAPQRDAGRWFWIAPHHGPAGYRTFFGVPSMPQLNTDHPAVRAHLIDAAQMWLREVDVDGFRLDYAHGPGHAFWARFWRAVKHAKPDAWCFGEVVDTPAHMRSYAGYLDGVLDFHLGAALRQVFLHQQRDLVWLDRFLHDHDAYFPPQARFSRPVFLDNHDMDRFLFHATGDANAALRLASLFLYTLSNPPLLYYGTEIGLEQRHGKDDGMGLEASREPMPWQWSAAQRQMVSFYRTLGALRRREPALRPRQRQTLFVAPDHYLGRQRRADHELLLALNRSRRPAKLHHPDLTGEFADLLTARTVILHGDLMLEPVQGLLLKPVAG